MRQLGNTDIQMTSIIMGCWQAGKAFWKDINDEDSIAAIRAAYDQGITVFDTAPVYGDGHSERLLGKTLEDVRDKIVIATKVFSDKLRYDALMKSFHESLENLRTDYIDLFQIHYPSGAWGSEIVPIEETMGALVELKNAGKIRAIGVSNFSLAELKKAREYGDIESVQPPYSLFWRQAGDELTPYCAQHNISILAYSPLAQGLLTGKFTREKHFPEGEFRTQHKLCEPEHYERVQVALDQLRPIATRNNMTLGQLALTWLVAQPNTFAIAGARTAEQVEGNAKVLHMSLSQDELDVIEKIGRSVTKHLDADPLMWK